MPKRRGHGEGTIFERKDGRWQGAITVGHTPTGRQKRLTVYGKTQADVRRKLDELKHQRDLGTLPTETLTTSTYFQRWLKHKASTIKPRTLDDYTYTLKHYVEPHLGKHKLDKLRPLHVQVMLQSIAETVSPDRANKARQVLYGAMKQAVLWQLIPRNPAEAVARLKVERREMTLWTAEEATKFLDAAAGDRYYALFYLAMSTGLRCGELLGLHWDDLSGGRLRVRRTVGLISGKFAIGTPKTRKGERVVTLTPDVLEVMERHRRQTDAERAELGEAWRRPEVVFPSEVGGYTAPNNLSRRWRRLQKAAGVRKVRLHDLRHLHASIAIRAGVAPKVLADRLGHARASFTLDVYTHLYDEQRDAAAVSIKSLLEGGGEDSRES